MEIKITDGVSWQTEPGAQQSEAARGVAEDRDLRTACDEHRGNGPGDPDR